MNRRPKKRAENLNDANIEAIVAILDGWTEKLSWYELIDAIESRMMGRYTRQALSQHERIKSAFQSTKTRVSGQPSSTKDASFRLSEAEAKVLIETNKRDKVTIARLTEEIRQLLEQYVTWAYNAHTKGLDIEFLNRPLPNIDREQTKLGRNNIKKDKISTIQDRHEKSSSKKKE